MEYIELVFSYIAIITIPILLLIAFIHIVCWAIKKYFKKDLMPKDGRTYEITGLIFKYTGYTLFFTWLVWLVLDLIILTIF